MIDGRRSRRSGRDSEAPANDVRHRLAVGARLVRLGVKADAVTATGVAVAAATAVLIGLGHLWIGVALLVVGGLMDTLDGIVAKAAGTSSPRGAFLDSVADRVADALIFGGVAWYLAVGRQPRDALLPLAILAVSSVVSYERAKAESLGFTAKGGLMERAERLILLGIALFFNVVLVPLLWVLLALTTCTAIGRFVRVWRQASGEPATRHAATEGLWRRGMVEARWRRLRETGSTGTRRRTGITGARWRSRRQREPLTTRLRGVLGTDGSGAARGPRTRGSLQKGTGRVRAARALRRRLDGGHAD